MPRAGEQRWSGVRQAAAVPGPPSLEEMSSQNGAGIAGSVHRWHGDVIGSGAGLETETRRRGEKRVGEETMQR